MTEPVFLILCFIMLASSLVIDYLIHRRRQRYFEDLVQKVYDYINPGTQTKSRSSRNNVNGPPPLTKPPAPPPLPPPIPPKVRIIREGVDPKKKPRTVK